MTALKQDMKETQTNLMRQRKERQKENEYSMWSICTGLWIPTFRLHALISFCSIAYLKHAVQHKKSVFNYFYGLIKWNSVNYLHAISQQMFTLSCFNCEQLNNHCP